MRRIQKMAMYVFVTLTCTFIITAISIAILYAKYGFPKAWSGMGFLGIAGIAGLAQLLFKKDQQKIQYDERDQQIQQKSALTGFMAAYLVVGLSTMLPFIILGYDAVIQTHWLPLIFMAAGLTHFYSWSIAILTQYGWRNKNE